MPYKQSLYDDFNDNTLDTSKWTIHFGGSNITVSSQRLNIASSLTYAYIHTPRLWNARAGIVACKLSRSGTTNTSSSDEFTVSLVDNAANEVGAYFTPHTADYEPLGTGDAWTDNEVYFDTTVGFGSSWTDGTWFGLGGARYNGVDTDMLYLYKSTNGVDWTVMAQFDFYEFDPSSVALDFGLGRWGGSSTFAVHIDDVSFFDYRTKVRVGGSWVDAKPKVRVDGSWVDARPVTRTSGGWEPLR